MTDERDPRIEAIFDAAKRDLDGDAFVRAIAGQIDGRRRRLFAGRIIVLLSIVALEVILESPLQQSMGVVAGTLATPVLPIQGDWLEFAFGPINTVAGLVGTVLVALHLLIRRLVH